MASTSQPIACQPSHPYQTQQAHFPSDTPDVTTAIPAPYYLGSPFSWKASSFGSRFYPGCSPGQLLSPLDPNDFWCGKMSSSVESDRGSFLNALPAYDLEGELCRDYACCGLQIEDLHGLVQHFEDVHVHLVDQPGETYDSRHFSLPAVPHYVGQQSHHAQQLQQSFGAHPPSYPHGGFNMDDMELEVEQSSSPSSRGPTPPDTPLTTPLSSHPSHSFPHFGPSMYPPPPPYQPALKTESLSGYPACFDYPTSLSATIPSSPASEENGFVVPMSERMSPYGCLPPALVFSGTSTPANTSAISRVPSPSSASHTSISPVKSNSTIVSRPTNYPQKSSRASTTLSRPASSLLLSKPFRCPKPNCNKSYKQANGLKYHMTHGSCNFTPPKDVEEVRALLASKRSARSAAGEANTTISEDELREVEREAERRLRPFICGIGDCPRRYKNMNGLRYHYQHSGDHGAIGLGLLASGQHQCLAHVRREGSGSASGSRQTTPSQSGRTTPMILSRPQTPTSTATTGNMGLPVIYQQPVMYAPTQPRYLDAQQQAMQTHT